MMRILPEWVGKERAELWRAVYDIADRQNINQTILSDSQSVHEAIDIIMGHLEIVKDLAKPQCDEKQLKTKKELERF